MIIRVVRSLAYDPALFERSTNLLRRFLFNDVRSVHLAEANQLKSLFTLYLSGTHASASQRAAFVRRMLDSTDAVEQELGLLLLGRDARFPPGTRLFFRIWGSETRLRISPKKWRSSSRLVFRRLSDVVRRAGAVSHGLSKRVRRVIANEVTRLVAIGMLDEVVDLASLFAETGGWPEGWIAIRHAIRQGKGKLSGPAVLKLEDIELRLRPRELASLIRSYALAPEWGQLDVADFEEDEEQTLVEGRQKIADYCVDLGRQLATDPEQFAALLPEILIDASLKTFELGRGIAKGCASLVGCWSQLLEKYLQIPESTRSPLCCFPPPCPFPGGN